MSQYGHPAYPQASGPTNQFPQKGALPYGQGSAPPYPQSGTSPYPPSGAPPYPQASHSQGGATAYPPGNAPPYTSGGAPPYSQGSAPSHLPGGAPPYPQGVTPSYSQAGAPPYPQQGVPSLHPPGGAPPYPQTGTAPSHQPPYPGQDVNAQTRPTAPPRGPSSAPPGQNPYPQGTAPYQPTGQSPYPPLAQGAPHQQGAAQAPYNQGQAPYPGAPPYPGQAANRAPYQAQGSGYPGQNMPPTGPSAVGGDRVVRPGTDQFKTRVEITLECRNLLNKDILSKSDPCAVLYMIQQGRWYEVGRTENVKNNLNPKFSKTFVINYFFEEVQKILISVYDIDNVTPQLTDDDFLGQVETTLGQIVSNSPFTSPLLLKNGMKAGQGVIIIKTEEIKEGCETALLTFRATKLDKKDFFGKSDPYLEIQRASADGSWQVVHRTEVVKNNLNPSWRPFELSVQKLCGGNKQQNIKIDCYDWDSDGSHDYIGGFVTTFNDMAKAVQQEVSWPCVNQATKAKKKSYTNSGTILLTSCKIIKEYSFLDFIQGGTQINFTVGIDFTASNGNPSQSSSLHYINPYQPNEYMAAIKAVGEVCQDYDSDKLFPVLGFGARIPPKMEISHEFAVNFNPQNPYCSGIDGILQAYYNCIQHVQLYGPTNAAPIIQHVARFAQTAQMEEPSKGPHAYFILLMLTDGVLSDMSNTRTAIVEASKLPMSLIIVGVGQADFNDMNILDGDNGVLRSASGEPAKRDIVQFVPFRDFRNSSPVELARHVLAEVPKQVTDYYKMRGLQPVKKPEV
ncbi:copine-3 [Biomphalaria glabrata]|nr:copine-3 [Biomphalaria glabrata]